MKKAKHDGKLGWYDLGTETFYPNDVYKKAKHEEQYGLYNIDTEEFVPSHALAPEPSWTQDWVEGAKQIVSHPVESAKEAWQGLLTPMYEPEEAETAGQFMGNIGKGVGNLAALPVKLPAQIVQELIVEPGKKGGEEGTISALKEMGTGAVDIVRGFGEFLLNPVGYQGFKEWADSGYEGKPAIWDAMKKQWSTDPVFSVLPFVPFAKKIGSISKRTGKPPGQVANEIKAKAKNTGMPPEEIIEQLEYKHNPLKELEAPKDIAGFSEEFIMREKKPQGFIEGISKEEISDIKQKRADVVPEKTVDAFKKKPAEELSPEEYWQSRDPLIAGAMKRELLKKQPIEEQARQAQFKAETKQAGDTVSLERTLEQEQLVADEWILGKGLSGEEGFARFSRDKIEKPKFTGKAAKVEQMYDRATIASQAKYKTTVSNVHREMKRQVVDVSGNLKKKLMKLGDLGERVKIRRNLIAGSSAKASRYIEKAHKKIYDGLDKTGKEYLDRFIQSRRTIAIERYKKISHPEALGITEHQAWLEQLPAELKANLNKRADVYFEEMAKPLKLLLDEGILTQDAYNALISKGVYSPRKFLAHIDPVIEQSIGGKKISIHDSGIKHLSQGSLGLLEKDSQLLLEQVINRTHARIFRNRANQALYDLAAKNPGNGVVSLPTGLSEKSPADFATIKVLINGKVKTMEMPVEMAKEWIVSDPLLSSTIANVIQWGSGAKILKPMATGLNPGFALTNFPRDIVHVWLTDYKNMYSSSLPFYMKQMASDIKIVGMDALKRKGRFNDFAEEGGLMPFLTHQGSVTSKLSGPLHDMQTVMGYFGETSEIVPRLALRERVLRQGLDAEYATEYARDYLDFSQGGSFIKAVDNGIPYLNASIQGTRGLVKSASMNKSAFAYKVAQLGAVSTALYYMNSFMFPDLIKQTSSRERANYWLVGTPFTFENKSGDKKRFYFRIAKDQGQRFFASIFEGLAAKGIGDDVDAEQITGSLVDTLPIIPQHNLPPILDATMGYLTNKDFWRNEDIWRKKQPIKPEEEWNMYTHPAFVEMGDILNMSPERLKYALSQFFTSGNVYTSLGGLAWKEIFDYMPQYEKNMVTEELILKQPFVKRVLKATDPYHEHGKKLGESITEANTERWQLTRGFDILSQGYYDGEVSEQKIKKYLAPLPDVEYDRLLDRHERRGKLQELPEKRWWLELATLPPEDRAIAFWNRYMEADQEEKAMLEEYVDKVPGVKSERFWDKIDALRTTEVTQ